MTELSERQIILISGGANTKPLWEPLSKSYDLAFLYPQSGQEAAGIGLPALPLAALHDADLQEAVENQSALLTTRVVNALPRISERFVAAHGLNAPLALNGHLGDWFAGYAHTLLQNEIAILAQLEKLAAVKRVVGCVTHEDVAPDTRAMVMWANAHGLPTIHVPHAPCHLLPGVVDIHRETRTSHLAASGPQVERFYTESGFDPARIRLTGAPHWDELYQGAIPDKREARAVLSVPTGYEHVLMYQTTWGQTTSLRSEFDKEFDAGFAATLEAARALGAYLMVKIHWNDGRPEREEFYAKQMDALGIEGLVTRQHYTYVLRAADCLIAQGPSNMCLDAAILGTSSVYLQTEGFDFATDYPRRCQPEGLLSAIRDTLETPGDLGAFVSQYNSVHPDGDATGKVVEWVRELCQ